MVFKGHSSNLKIPIFYKKSRTEELIKPFFSSSVNCSLFSGCILMSGRSENFKCTGWIVCVAKKKQGAKAKRLEKIERLPGMLGCK